MRQIDIQHIESMEKEIDDLLDSGLYMAGEMIPGTEWEVMERVEFLQKEINEMNGKYKYEVNMEEITYQCKYYVVRYVASPIRDEAINIGVILKSSSPLEWYGCKFTKDLSNLDATQGDKYIIEEYIKEFANNPSKVDSKVELGNIGKLQITPSRGCVTEVPDLELDSLFETFVQRP